MKSSRSKPARPVVDKDLARARRKKAAALAMMRATGKTGRNSLGKIENTPLAREAFALGEAYRRAQTAR